MCGDKKYVANHLITTIALELKVLNQLYESVWCGYDCSESNTNGGPVKIAKAV